MREITHLVLLGRVSGGTAKKGDIDLSEQDPAKIVKKGDTELTDWRPAVYVAGRVVWHTAMHSRSRDWVKTGKAQPEQMFPLYFENETYRRSPEEQSPRAAAAEVRRAECVILGPQCA